MTLSYVQYVADGENDEFDVPFPFANRTHVKISIDGVPPVLPIRWIGEARIQIVDNLVPGSLVEIRRDTPLSERLVDFQNGSVLTEEELDLAINQVFYLQQELKDQYDRGLGKALTRLATENGLTTVDPHAVIQELANLILENEVLANFQQAISDIGLNAESITAQALDITNINAAVDQADSVINTLQSNVTNVGSRVDTLRADHERLVTVVDALAGGEGGTGIATLIQDETNARIAGDTAITNTVNLIGAKSADGLSFILNLNTAKVSPTETLSQRLSALSATGNNNAAAIITEQSARISADTALASDVSSLYARVDTADAAVITEKNARISGDSALASSLNALTTRVGTAESAIVTEQSARITGDNALATNIQGLTSRVGAVESDIITEQTTRASADSALSTSLSALTSRVGTAESAIVTEQTTRANADTAIASELSLLGAKNAGATAFVIDTSKAQIGGGETLATRFSALATADSNNLAAIQSEQTARISGDNALTSSVNSLGTRMDTAEAAIVTEQDARIAGDTAEANARAALAARVTTAESAITSEQTARANGDNALASDLALLGAKNAGGTAWVLDMNKVQVSAGTSLGTRLSGIDTSVGNNAAAIASEQTARTTADSALASDISTLTTTVNGNTASISTLQSSVNGLSAKYGVSLDVNGYVTGFVQNNNGTSGTFTILADKFSVVAPSGGSPITPFTVTAEGVQINGSLVVNGSITSNSLASGAVTASTVFTNTAAITASTSWQSVASATISAVAGSVVKIDFSVRLTGQADTTSIPANYRLKRGSTVIREGVLHVFQSKQVYTDYVSYNEYVFYQPVDACFAAFHLDNNPGAASHTYTLEILGSDAFQVSDRQMVVTELRR